MDDHYKTVYHIVDAAANDMNKMATNLVQAADDDLSQMRNVAGFAWNGSNAEAMGIKYAQVCKNTGSYGDEAHGTAGAYGNVREIGQTCESHVNNIIGI
ncbi:hypothetical protein DMC64_33910 [Amycolatopsis sp. WAC 04197]|nr:hypothetical protein DMC64_33910 [Amycolatopsis sp. WAC 04197]